MTRNRKPRAKKPFPVNKNWDTSRNQTPLSEQLGLMAVGDYFVVEGDVQLTRVNVSAWGRRHKKKFSIRKQGNGANSYHVCTRVKR